MLRNLKLRWHCGRLMSKDPGSRRAAAEALGRLGDARAVEPLIQALGDKRAEVRRAAGQALASLGQPVWEGRVRGDCGDYDRLGDSGDARAVEPLIRALRDEEKDARSKAAAALGRLGDGRAVEPLIQALKDEDELVRNVAATYLGTIGDTRALEPLREALNDKDTNVRESAQRAFNIIAEKST